MHTGTNAAHGPRTPAPSATTTSNIPALLAALKAADAYVGSAGILAEFDYDVDRTLYLIESAERALADARAAVAQADGGAA